MNSAQQLALLQLGEAGEKCVAQLIGHSAITLLENALPLEAA